MDDRECENYQFWLGEKKDKSTVSVLLPEYTTDPRKNIAKGAVKYDGGKSPIFRGCLSYFPKALAAVAEVSEFGAKKYAWKGWLDVPDGYTRYSDALVRHLAAESSEDNDPDSGLAHAAHAAWNALARLELILQGKK